MSPTRTGIAAIAAQLRARQLGVRELVQEAADRAQTAQAAQNSFITLIDEDALRTRADQAQARIDAGDADLLCGIPYAHKDLFCTEGLRTTAASRMLADFVPPYSASVHERIDQRAGVLIGKTNMDEFAMGSSNENSAFGACRNPWDDTRVPGGSSGGSAAAVAQGVVPYATGSDTGGSVRQPAAFCGVTGIKPTYGRIPRWGLIADASSLDQAGVIARSAEDCAIVLDALMGHDARDATCTRRVAPACRAALEGSGRRLRIGVPAALFSAGIRSEVGDVVHAALADFARQGAELVPVALPNLALSIPAYYVIAPAEASSNLARYDGVRYGHRCENPASLEDLYMRTRAEGFGSEVQRRILVGTHVLSSGYYDAYYLRAQKVRRLLQDDFTRAFESVDLIAGPTTPDVAFRIGEKSSDPLAMYAADINTVAVNLAGLPAMSIPAGFVSGLPVGLQLIAPAFAEAELLAAAHAFQQETDWHLKRPESAHA